MTTNIPTLTVIHYVSRNAQISLATMGMQNDDSTFIVTEIMDIKSGDLYDRQVTLNIPDAISLHETLEKQYMLHRKTSKLIST